MSEVRVIVYDSILRGLPRDEDKPPICDRVYTREMHEAKIKRIEFGLAEAVRHAVPTGPYKFIGGFEYGEFRVTAKSGRFVVTITNVGYTLDLRRFPKRKYGQVDFRVYDAFFSPLLTQELDQIMWSAHARVHYSLFRNLSGQGLLMAHDRFLELNP